MSLKLFQLNKELKYLIKKKRELQAQNRRNPALWRVDEIEIIEDKIDDIKNATRIGSSTHGLDKRIELSNKGKDLRDNIFKNIKKEKIEREKEDKYTKKHSSTKAQYEQKKSSLKPLLEIQKKPTKNTIVDFIVQKNKQLTLNKPLYIFLTSLLLFLPVTLFFFLRKLKQ